MPRRSTKNTAAGTSSTPSPWRSSSSRISTTVLPIAACGSAMSRRTFATMPSRSSRCRFSPHTTIENFEIFCYADVLRPDEITARLRSCADVWRNIAGLGDEQVAQWVRQDRIDILVDLTMHMARNRLLVFARKPAPVQVCWLAYPGTTGLSTIDYRLTDPYIDPPGLTTTTTRRNRSAFPTPSGATIRSPANRRSALCRPWTRATSRSAA